MKFHYQGVYANIDPMMLPTDMDIEIFLDLGENSNANKLQKLQQVGQVVLPGLMQAGAQMAIKPEATVVLATDILEALGLDSNDYLKDYTDPQFQQEAMQALQQMQQQQQIAQQVMQQKAQADLDLQVANVAYTNAQAKNTSDDNTKQLAVALDKHHQEWADLSIKAMKEGAEIPPAPNFEELLIKAKMAIDMTGNAPAPQAMPPAGPPQGAPMGPQQGMPQPLTNEVI
jgi:hypothetical protein